MKKLLYIILVFAFLSACDDSKHGAPPKVDCTSDSVGYDYTLDYLIGDKLARNAVFDGDFEDFYTYDYTTGCYVLKDTHDVGVGDTLNVTNPFYDVSASISGAVTYTPAGPEVNFTVLGQNIGNVTAFGVKYALYVGDTVIAQGDFENPIPVYKYEIVTVSGVSGLSFGSVFIKLVLFDYFGDSLSTTAIILNI